MPDTEPTTDILPLCNTHSGLPAAFLRHRL